MHQIESSFSVGRVALLPTLAVILLTAAGCGPTGNSDAESVDEVEVAEGADEHGAVVEGRVTLTEATLRNAGIEVVEVRAEPPASLGSALQVPGQVVFPPDRVALISPRTPGRVERLTVVEGDRVEAGQRVADLLSPSFLTAQNDLLQAAQRRDLLAGTEDEEGAEALVGAARRRLQLMGAPDDVIESLESGGEPLDLLPIRAPFTGSIVESYTLPGAALEAGGPIFRIADLSVVDVVADVPEQAIRHLAMGQTATIRLPAYPDRMFSGRIERLHEELDPETRTVGAIVHVPNPNRILRPGMFAEVILQVPLGLPDDVSSLTVTIPSSSVVTDEGERYVFVEIAPRTFERRLVETAPLADESRLAVLAGLAVGERVVARGAFTLKSELGKAEFGEEGH